MGNTVGFTDGSPPTHDGIIQMGCGWEFKSNVERWELVEANLEQPDELQTPLRLATLNVLFDAKPGKDPTLPDVLQHDIRYDAICRQLASLDAHIIGLNEVTQTMLEKLLQEDWVRKQYRISAVVHDQRCEHLSVVKRFGNVLLSKLRTVSLEHVESPGGREFPVMTCCIARHGGQSMKIAIASAHLTAFPYLNETSRAKELEVITSELAQPSRGLDGSIVMGDFNFHRESENTSIPASWVEVPSVVALGPTWDMERNTMLPHYLPLRNIYNGFGTGYGWPAKLRLDRMLVMGAGFDCTAAIAKMFADQPIHQQTIKSQQHAQQSPRSSHRQLPWEAYLFPSDHFGLMLKVLAHIEFQLGGQ